MRKILFVFVCVFFLTLNSFAVANPIITASISPNPLLIPQGGFNNPVDFTVTFVITNVYDKEIFIMGYQNLQVWETDFSVLGLPTNDLLVPLTNGKGAFGNFSGQTAVVSPGATLTLASPPIQAPATNLTLVLFQLNIPKFIERTVIASALFITPCNITIDSTSSVLMRSIVTVL